MMQVQVRHSLMLTLISGLLLSLHGSWAASMGRQRRVQTSATTTGHAPPSIFGPHLWYATFNTKDEYVETPFTRRAASRQQPKHLASNIYAEELGSGSESARSSSPSNVAYGDVEPTSELTPAQVQQLLLFNTPRYFSPSASSRVGMQDLEPRFFHLNMMGFNPYRGSSHGERNHTNVNINNNNVTVFTPTTPAPLERIFNAHLMRSPQLMTNYQMRQGPNAGQDAAEQRLPYELYDLYGGGLRFANNVGSLGGASSGVSSLGGLGAFGGLGGAGVPLVPVTLNNNAVGYVPLNLRMFRHLQQAALPIREGEDDPTALSGSADETLQTQLEQEPESVSNDVGEETADKLKSSRFPMFGQRWSQRPINDGLSMIPFTNNPLMAFANNIRRTQYL
ncbi:GH12269 [Drosophila grimshawi]|uniref:GH12269 n=1 Tax=Drosophila grimshawi TaxID=7222 RepID=B4JJE8_DROGR|nr:GH12269 [Drosophila grimshawi]